MSNLDGALRQLRTAVARFDFDAGPSLIDASEPFLILSAHDAPVFIHGEDSESFHESVQGVFDAVSAKDVISRDSVERLVGDLVVSAARAKHENPSDFNTRLDEQIRILKTALQSEPSRWEFYIPVIWLAPSELPFRMGRVDFYQTDDSGTQEYWRRVSELNPAYAGMRAEEALSIDFAAEFGNKTVARVQVCAVDATAAQSLAVKAVRQTLDCLNFFSNDRIGTGLYVRGDVERGLRVDAVIHLAEPAQPSGRFTSLSPRRSFPIRQVSQRRGFGRISELLKKDTLSQLEARILKAIQWAGRARVERRTEQSFLLFAVALETLLLKDSGSPTELQYKLKLRTALLVSGRDLASKKLTVRQIGDLYTTRSKIVHAGKFDVTDSELELIDQYARVALSVVLDREPFRTMTEEKDFEDWFEARLLAPDEKPAVG
jgi:hypothetical protein